MPLFEIEPGRPALTDGGAGAAEDVVDHHIDSLIGEQVFHVHQGVDATEPHLLALDAAGAPVVVELVPVLDSPVLARALDHAGAAGRMSRAQLAARYTGGPEAFQRDIAAFYDSVPVKRSLPGRAGARLIIVCQHAEPAVLNAVDFLRQPSMPVEVLRVDMVDGADGRRFMDVSPLVIHPDSAPDNPRIASSASVMDDGGSALPAPSEPAPVPAPSDPAPARSRRSRRDLRQIANDGPETPAAVEVREDPRPPTLGIAAVVAAGSSPADPGNWETIDPRDARAIPIPVANEGQLDERLVRLAHSLGREVTIVWERPRRQQRFQARLMADGVILTETGAIYRHPDSAARALSGAANVDGWAHWQIGSAAGQTLDEAYAARFGIS